MSRLAERWRPANVGFGFYGLGSGPPAVHPSTLFGSGESRKHPCSLVRSRGRAPEVFAPCLIAEVVPELIRVATDLGLDLGSSKPLFLNKNRLSPLLTEVHGER